VNTKRVTLLTAAVLALGTGYLTISYLGSIQRQAAPHQSTMRVVIVAAVDIAPRAKIALSMLRRSRRSADEIDPDAVADERQAAGKHALISIPAGSTITQSKIGRPADTVFAVRIPHGMRAVSIAIDRVKGVSGLVQPGDRVDVIAIPPRVNGAPKAYTIIRGAVVMALGNQLETAGATTPNIASPDFAAVTLAVSPQQADLLSMADVNTTLRLALRPPEESARSLPPENLVFANAPEAPATLAQPIVNALPMYAPPMSPPQPPAATAVPQPRGVTVIDGDRIVPQSDAPATR
jgi:pilus assembly protein CpaB